MIFMAIHEYFERHGDPRVNQYILMSSVWTPLMMTAAYLVFVQIIGPWFMRDRKPYNIKKIVMAYNILQVALNSYLTITVLYAFSRVPLSSCIDIDYSESERGYRELSGAHFFYILKILDCADTIFFVLKKSYRQMSFLHIYHHAAMILVSWFAAKYFGGGQSGWACIFNAVIHVLMYGYYFASAYNPEYKNIPIKKYMTQLQMLQFVLLLYFYGYPLVSSCEYNKAWSAVVLSQGIIFLILFSNFYIHAYVKPKKR